MSFNLFDQLADADVPPVPADLDRQVHQRVNDSLLALQFVDLFCRAMPFALLHFAVALIGLIRCTLFGEIPNDRR